MFIDVKKDICVGCNSCIRVCPAKDVNIARTVEGSTHTIIDLDKSRCINCGACLKGCLHHARIYRDDTETFFEDLRKGADIVLMVAPAFRIIEPNADAILKSLTKMGVKATYDVSYGADICTWAHIRAIQKKMVGKVISQPCAAITEYITKYKPSLVKYLSPVHSPMSCMATFLRKTLRVTAQIATISPCIAKKQEFDDTGLVQYNVTFKQLVQYMEANNLIDSYDGGSFKYTNLPAFCGKIYPRPGGLKECLLNINPNLNVVTSEGVDHVYHSFDVYEKTPDQYKPDVFDVLSCATGCIEGPATNHQSEKQLEYSATMSKVEARAFNQRSRQTRHIGKKSDKQFAWFDKNININDYIRSYAKKEITRFEVSHAQLENAYKMLLKNDEASRKFNCQACGYETCEDMARAIASGLNLTQNCHQYVSMCVMQEQQEVEVSNEKLIEVNQNITSVVSDVMLHVNEISDQAQTVASKSADSLDSMQNIREYINTLSEECQAITAAMKGVANANQRYKEMSTAIKSITDQTHILSINASVEAARAGEIGKSFAVVATEIRNLAASTKSTTDTVEQNDADIRSEIETVEKIADNLQLLLNSLSGTLDEFSTLVRDTASAGSSIDDNVADISADTDKLRQLTQ